jgi:hypothetical protein
MKSIARNLFHVELPAFFAPAKKSLVGGLLGKDDRKYLVVARSSLDLRQRWASGDTKNQKGFVIERIHNIHGKPSQSLVLHTHSYSPIQVPTDIMRSIACEVTQVPSDVDASNSFATLQFAVLYLTAANLGRRKTPHSTTAHCYYY